VQPHPLLGGHGAGEVGVELVLPDLHDRSLDVVDTVGGQQPLGPLRQQPDLVRVGHRERIHVVGRDPGDVAVHRFVGELDRLGVDRAADPGDLDRLLGDPDRGLRGQVDAGGEAPGPVVHDPHREADVLALVSGIDPPVAQHQVLAADSLQPEVRVRGAQLADPAQGRVGKPSHRQLEKCGIDLCHQRLLSLGTDPSWRHRLFSAIRTGAG
jgi:hypothetical protein